MKNAFISILLLLNFSVLAQIDTDNSDSASDKTQQLLNAARSGDTKTIKSLLNNGTGVNATDTNGATALMKAAYHGHTNAVELLLDNGADVNAKDNEGFTALMFAADQDHTEPSLPNFSRRNEKSFRRFAYSCLFQQNSAKLLLQRRKALIYSAFHFKKRCRRLINWFAGAGGR